jgi:formylglycine-generating enzyme
VRSLPQATGRARSVLSWSCAGAIALGCNSILGNPPPEGDDGSGGRQNLGGLGGHGGEEPASGGTHAGSGGTDSSGGAAGSGGNAATPGTVGVVGEPCAPNSALGCSGHAKKGQLICEHGEWKNNGTCSGSSNCDTSDAAAGSCQPILTDCEGAEVGDPTTACSDNVPQVCGVDLTTLEDGAACDSDQACVDGECLPIVPECLGKTPGDQVCSEDGTKILECGTDLVDTDVVDPCGPGSVCVDAVCVQASCAGLADTCGRFEDDDCCTTLLVSGAALFYRGTGTEYPATIGDFRLDKYEVTVGRFRKFAAAWDGGWRPTAGAGRHTHLGDGLGLSTTTDGTEGGWDGTWAANVDISDAARGAGSDGTWTGDVDESETLPINNVNWFEAYAFAIWDGGFLPSEAEWEYAAAGGVEEQTYPWGDDEPDCSYANFYDGYNTNDWCVGGPSVVGSDSPKGDGFWQQSDLGGNLWEWTLDWYATYSATCTDCTNATTATYRVVRGGHWGDYPESLAAAYRDYFQPTDRFFKIGLRVARSP